MIEVGTEAPDFTLDSHLGVHESKDINRFLYEAFCS